MKILKLFFSKTCAYIERYRNLLAGVFRILTFDLHRVSIVTGLSSVARRQSDCAFCVRMCEFADGRFSAVKNHRYTADTRTCREPVWSASARGALLLLLVSYIREMCSWDTSKILRVRNKKRRTQRLNLVGENKNANSKKRMKFGQKIVREERP